MPKRELVDERLTHSVIGGFFAVYNELGYGFLESVYAAALEQELVGRGHRVAREVPVSVYFKGLEVARQRLDCVVDERLIVECKSTLDLKKTALRQVYNYLRATNLEVGLLLHFGPEPQFFRVFRSNRGPILERYGNGNSNRPNSDETDATDAPD